MFLGWYALAALVQQDVVRQGKKGGKASFTLTRAKTAIQVEVSRAARSLVTSAHT